MTIPDAHRLFAEAAAREHAALEDYARRIRAANDRHPPLHRDLIWQSPLLIAAATVALIVGITLLGRAMVG